MEQDQGVLPAEAEQAARTARFGADGGAWTGVGLVSRARQCDPPVDDRLQVTYRVGPETSSVSQLNLYNSYRTRFDPYASHAPLLGGQELIQLVCATFPGCEMAKDSEDYVMKGLKLREGADMSEGEQWEKGVDGLVEPLRASTW